MYVCIIHTYTYINTQTHIHTQVLDIGAVINGLFFLFLEPNPQDPLNKEAAELMKAISFFPTFFSARTHTHTSSPFLSQIP
jgi:hypothetical protein